KGTLNNMTTSRTSFRIEDIMTPRSLFVSVFPDEADHAPHLAEEKGFDVIPIVRKGEIADYWSRKLRKVKRITQRHRIPHNTSVEDVLARLNRHLIQFVYYRTEVVGLVDLSDLNKPLGRLAWLQAILECEQAIMMRALEKNFSES